MPKNETIAYIHLGGAFVPAGRLTMTQTASQVISEFGYGHRYLERPDTVALDPLQLPLTTQRFQTLGLFGAFRDSSPDGWGRHLLDRAAEEFGHAPTEYEYLTVLDQDNRTGALAFGPDLKGPRPYQPEWRPAMVPGDGLDLASMITAVDTILRLEDLPTEYRRFVLRGSSIGGAQPKAAIEFEGRAWIAKFSRELEAWPTCRIEMAAMNLAKACGIRTALCRLLEVHGRDVLLSERFDRAPGGTRRHFVTAMTLTGAKEMNKGSYGDIARAMRRFCSVEHLAHDLEELFRRMVFNVVCNNTDDHLLNHGFLYDPELKTWRLSPAYDIVPQPQMSKGGKSRLTLGVGDQGSLATLENALTRCEDFGIRKDAAQATIDELLSIASKWKQENRTWGVPEQKIEALAEAWRF